jgi:hypothetical protein
MHGILPSSQNARPRPTSVLLNTYICAKTCFIAVCGWLLGFPMDRLAVIKFRERLCEQVLAAVALDVAVWIE